MHRFFTGGMVAVVLMMHSAVITGQVLVVPEVIQEQTEWCWAGVSCCVLSYYGTSLSQCTIADYARTHATFHDFGSVSCCDASNKQCNYWNYNWGHTGSIQDILKEWGVQSRGSGGMLKLDAVRSELRSGRPFIIRWSLKPGNGGHFIVGHGIKDSTLYYMNPWPGEGLKIADYSWVVSSSSHDWQGTNVISTNPSVPGPVTLVTPRDGSKNQSRTLLLVWKRTGTGAESYQFQCATDMSFTLPVKDTVLAADTTFRLSGLSLSTEYFWRVRISTTAGAAGAWSMVWRFTTESATAVVADMQYTGFAVIGRLVNRTLSVTYNVPAASQVTIGIHTLRGELLRLVCHSFHRPGRYTQYLSGMDLAPGNYVLSIHAGNYRTTTLLVHDAGNGR